jgi:hypothetical protein
MPICCNLELNHADQFALLFNVLLSLGSNYEHIVEAKVENLSTSFL